jgi:hypothetical protein
LEFQLASLDTLPDMSLNDKSTKKKLCPAQRQTRSLLQKKGICGRRLLSVNAYQGSVLHGAFCAQIPGSKPEPFHSESVTFRN